METNESKKEVCDKFIDSIIPTEASKLVFKAKELESSLEQVTTSLRVYENQINSRDKDLKEVLTNIVKVFLNHLDSNKFKAWEVAGKIMDAAEYGEDSLPSSYRPKLDIEDRELERIEKHSSDLIILARAVIDLFLEKL